MNVVSMYQSPNDLKFPDDKTLDGNALLQSMNVNSQIKLVYGGADYDTAEWLSNLSGTITKSVTSMEKTNVRTMGAEEWERGRMIKAHEEATVPVNVVLSLPPRVAILIQPHQLATPCFTAPAKVRDLKLLPAWLTGEAKRIYPAPAPLPSPAPEAATQQPSAQTEKLEHAQVQVGDTPKQTFNMDDILAEGLQETSRENLTWVLGKRQRDMLQTRVSKEEFEAAQARLDQLKAADSHEGEAPPEKKLEHAQVSEGAKKTPPPAPKYELEAVLATPKEFLTPDQCIWLFKTPARIERAKPLFTEEEAAKWKQQANARKGQAAKEAAPPLQPTPESEVIEVDDYDRDADMDTDSGRTSSSTHDEFDAF